MKTKMLFASMAALFTYMIGLGSFAVFMQADSTWLSLIGWAGHLLIALPSYLYWEKFFNKKFGSDI